MDIFTFGTSSNANLLFQVRRHKTPHKLHTLSISFQNKNVLEKCKNYFLKFNKPEFNGKLPPTQ